MRAPTILCLFAFCSLSCGGNRSNTKTSGIEIYEPTTPPLAHPLVKVWVDPDPDLPLAQMQAGCDIWKDEGARCTLNDPRETAVVRVWAFHGPCAKNDDDTYTLATAYSDGKIIFNVECFKRGADKKLDLKELAVVMGHELGHQFGIWDHVPTSCDADDVKTHPSGKKVCGPALMNPVRRKEIFFLTPLDDLAFDLRDTKYSVLASDDPAADVPTCIYRTER